MPTSWRDLTLTIALLFVVIVFFILPFINDPTKNDETEPPGNVIVSIVWPPALNYDVDLWMMAPGETRPVGYSNLSGKIINLLRDDLGTYSDPTPLNYESAYTRGAAEGEYQVNVHCYRCTDGPVTVDVEIAIKSPTVNMGNVRVIARTKVELTAGEERTAIRFNLDAKGNLVGQPTHYFTPLRSSQ